MMQKAWLNPHSLLEIETDTWTMPGGSSTKSEGSLQGNFQPHFISQLYQQGTDSLSSLGWRGSNPWLCLPESTYTIWLGKVSLHFSVGSVPWCKQEYRTLGSTDEVLFQSVWYEMFHIKAEHGGPQWVLIIATHKWWPKGAFLDLAC